MVNCSGSLKFRYGVINVLLFKLGTQTWERSHSVVILPHFTGITLVSYTLQEEVPGPILTRWIKGMVGIGKGLA